MIALKQMKTKGLSPILSTLRAQILLCLPGDSVPGIYRIAPTQCSRPAGGAGVLLSVAQYLHHSTPCCALFYLFSASPALTCAGVNTVLSGSAELNVPVHQYGMIQTDNCQIKLKFYITSLKLALDLTLA